MDKKEIKTVKRHGGSYSFREAKVPQPTELVDKSKSLMKWGADNLYPQFLFKLYYEEPTHGGIINSKVTFITSGGLTCSGCSPSDFETIERNGSNAYSLSDIIPIVARDNEVTDAFVYYFKRSLNGSWYLLPMDVELIRKDENNSNLFHYSEDWSSNKQDESTAYREIIGIDGIDDQTMECIMYVSSRAKQYNVAEQGKKAALTQNYYPTPIYSGAISSIMANEEMNFFHYSEVVNGFKGGTLLSFNNGEPDNETEENKIIKKVKGEASNRSTQGGLAITWSDGKERAPTVTPLNGNNLDSRYLLTQESLRDSILVAHSVITPALFGIKTAGQLGNTQELLTGYLVFKDSYVRKRQKQIAESLTYALKTLNGFTGEIEFEDFIPEYLGGTKEAADGKNVEEAENVAGTAMNGAQIASLVGIVEAVGLGTLTNEAAVQVIGVAFPTISKEQAQKIVGMGDAFVFMFKKKDKEPTAEEVLTRFETIGKPREDFEFLQSRGLQVFEGIESNETEYLDQYIKDSFANGITDTQSKIMNMIDGGESYQSIKQATDLSAVDLTKDILRLKQKQLIDPDEWKLSDAGKKAIEVEVKFKVVYTYELRPDAPALVKGGESREFCTTLIGMSRVYTREEIDTITGEIGRNVWLFRGGWYHDPKKEINQPSCRHYWKQNIISQ